LTEIGVDSSELDVEVGDMGSDAVAGDKDEPELLCHWSARKLSPIILLYVSAVYAVMIVLALLVFHSGAAVKVLALAAVGTIVPLFVEVSKRIEYRLTTQGLERRPHVDQEPRDYQSVFQLDELSHVVPIRHGFKFYKPLDESNPLRRVWKQHVSDRFSGEVHVEKEDQDKVLAVLAQHGVSSR
jgi:hypothetical protein